MSKGTGSNVSIVGNLASDPQLFTSSNGKSVVSITVAHTEGWGDRQHPVFTKATLFGKTAEVANDILRKGNKVWITGPLDEETWTTKDGIKKSRTVIPNASFEALGSNPKPSTQEDTQPSNPIDDLPI